MCCLTLTLFFILFLTQHQEFLTIEYDIFFTHYLFNVKSTQTCRSHVISQQKSYFLYSYFRSLKFKLYQLSLINCLSR